MPVGVKKIFLKKKDAVKSLFRKSLTTMKKRYLIETLEVDVANHEPCPLVLQPVINPILEKVRDARHRVVEDETLTIKGSLNYLSDDELVFLKKDLEKKKYAEEHINTMMNLMVKDIGKIDDYILQLKIAKQEVITHFLESVASQYSTEDGSEVKYDFNPLKEEVKETINYRRGLRRGSHQGNDAGEVAEDRSNCIFM